MMDYEEYANKHAEKMVEHPRPSMSVARIPDGYAVTTVEGTTAFKTLPHALDFIKWFFKKREDAAAKH